MFNFLLLVSTIPAVFGFFHHGDGQNEEALNPPVILLRSNRAVFPQERNVLSQKLLSERELSFIQGLFKTARKKRYLLVYCEYFLQTEDGKTVGILMDNDQGLAEGFDLYTETFHNMKMIQDRADQERLYILIHELFESTNSTLRTSNKGN